MPDLSLAARVSALDPYRITMRSSADARIVTGAGADWFGPLAPMAPLAPDQVAGRQFDYPPGFNLTTQPRAYEPIGFADLRAIADAYDLMRTIIETRKDQMARLEWTVRPRERQARAGRDDGRIKAIAAFLRKPDGSNFWDTWLRELLEDLLVIDAPALWAERNRGGQLVRLHPIDGATIKRVIDDWGRTPEAPLPAYQQVLHGLPAVDYTTRDILYRPRNTRVHKVYGFSPVEQILVTVNIALRRQVYQLQYYTEGNIPEALIGAPEGWTPEQIERFQLYWDSLNAGNTAQRRHARFVPGGVAKTFIPTKEPELTGATDEWLARLCCFAFSVSAQPFVRMMNRATAETAQDQALSEGLVPLQHWVKQLIDDVIAVEFGAPDLEFRWQDDRPDDPEKTASIAAEYVKSGIKSVNEVRAELGLDPVKGGEAPTILTAQGPVGLGVAASPSALGKSAGFARFNPNHYGPGPQGGQFAPTGEDGAAGDDDSPRGQQLAQDDESAEARAGRNLPFVGAAEAAYAARNPAETASELPRILQQYPADYANARAAYLELALPEVTRRYVTIGVGVVEDAQGARSAVYSSTEADGYGRSYSRSTVEPLLQPDEVAVPSSGHAEINILEYGKATGLRVIAVGAGRPYCAECARALDNAGVMATGPRK